MPMENGSTPHTSTSSATKRNTSISMSSDSLDFFYSPYPFDSPPALQPPIVASSNHVLDPSPDDSMTPDPTILPLPPPPAATATKKTKNYLSYLATTAPPPALPLSPPPPPPPPPPAASTHLMTLSCWNEEEVMGTSVEGRRTTSHASLSLMKKQRPSIPVKVKVNKVGVSLRICQVILCFLSFFVMVSDKTRGWTGDSYYRYTEYRYLVGVNIVGCIHSGVEACDMSYSLVTGGKHVISSHRIRYYLDFFIDQIVAYLLMSATSAAATRKGEWVSNWGKDEFTNMANASICLSFLAFFAFAFTCLFSALNLFTTSNI